MKQSEMIDAIVKLEWPMFNTVNGEDRTDCQENPGTFDAMRRAQFDAWSEEAVAAYLRDEIGFYDITDIVAECMHGTDYVRECDLDTIFETDTATHRRAAELAARIASKKR